jgi:glycerophosphoryl diester phosphodiesterase
MKIISHRGLWLDPSEKNTEKSFRLSFQNDFGIETDVRDSQGDLVISHDAPQGGEMKFSYFLSLIKEEVKSSNLILALNIKSDGLSELLFEKIKGLSGVDIFVFDMSVPDMQSYLNLDIQVFTRLSDLEKDPACLDHAAGVWLDSFNSDWFKSDIVSNLLTVGKKVCIVSPELHGREYTEMWREIAILKEERDLILCTDYPVEAKNYFGL